MKICYENWNPRDNSLFLVAQAIKIIELYEEQNYVLTLRQLYYQFVARDLIENSERSYKNLGTVITKARMSGLISWEAIEDRNREHNNFWYQEDELKPIKDLPYYIRFDRWARQPYYVEVWFEKEALGNVIARACKPWLVPYMSCKGYLSASEAWRAGRRFKEKIEQGKECVLIHLGDHDPSGIDMTRDNGERLDVFTEYLGAVDVRRIALNIDQVRQYTPPPNPAKITDTRAKNYIRKYGRTSWELDALEPSVLEGLITSEIESLIDPDEWDLVNEEEEEKQALLSNIFNKWDVIKTIIE